MSENPYIAPSAELHTSLDLPLGVGTRLYSPKQVAAGAFLGGPVGLAYFLWANFAALGKHNLARRVLLIAAGAIPLLFVGLCLMPSGAPSLPIALAQVYLGQWVATRHQMSRRAIEASYQVSFQSNWRVFLLGLLCLVATMIVGIAVVVALAASGLWTPSAGA